MTLTYRVDVAREVDVQVRSASTARDVRRAFTQAYRDLSELGCSKADYRLSGPGQWPRHCVKKLPWGWKLVMDFPSDDEVRLLVLEPHDNRIDPYSTLAEIRRALRTLRTLIVNQGSHQLLPGCAHAVAAESRRGPM